MDSSSATTEVGWAVDTRLLGPGRVGEDQRVWSEPGTRGWRWGCVGGGWDTCEGAGMWEDGQEGGRANGEGRGQRGWVARRGPRAGSVGGCGVGKARVVAGMRGWGWDAWMGPGTRGRGRDYGGATPCIVMWELPGLPCKLNIHHVIGRLKHS